MQNLWWLVSVFASFVFGMYIFANQVFKLKGSLVMIYRGIGTALVMLPFAFLVPALDTPVFYYLCIFQGLVIAYFDNRMFNAAKIFGAETTAVIQPLSVVFVFFSWFLIKPQQLFDLAQNPLKLTLTIVAILCIVASVWNIKKGRISKTAFLYLLPALLSVTIIDLGGKFLMDMGSADVFSAIFYYSLITSIVAGSANAVAYFKQGNKIDEVLMPRNIVCAGIPIVVLILSMYTFKNYSLYLAENPGYVMAIIYAYPIWILLANNLYSAYFNHKIYSKINKLTVFMMVVSIIALVWAVQS